MPPNPTFHALNQTRPSGLLDDSDSGNDSDPGFDAREFVTARLGPGAVRNPTKKKKSGVVASAPNDSEQFFASRIKSRGLQDLDQDSGKIQDSGSRIPEPTKRGVASFEMADSRPRVHHYTHT